MFNTGFPVTYPQLPLPNFQQQLPANGMTPPTIHADIIQVASEEEAWNYPVAAGSSQMMMAKDDSAIFVKSAFPNSQPSMDIYRKEQRKEKPAADYVTRDELEAMLAELKEKNA